MHIVSHTTALSIWRALRRTGGTFGPIRIVEAQVSCSDTTNVREFISHLDSGFSSNETLHLLVLARNQTHRISRTYVHCSHVDHRRGSFVRISPDIAVVSPDLLFLQMASVLPLERLLLLGLELCGTFTIDVDSPKGFTDELQPVTTPGRIVEYVRRMSAMNNSAVALRAASMLAENSASPQESRLFIKLAGPRSIGGYGVCGLALNHDIELSANAAKLAGQRICRPDLSIASARLAIEYDSAYAHANEIQSQKDKRRRDALALDGWHTKSVVPAMANDPDVFDIFAKDVLARAGQSSRIRVKGFIEKRNHLFKTLRTFD